LSASQNENATLLLSAIFAQSFSSRHGLGRQRKIRKSTVSVSGFDC
jgi:hypothetical protein